MADLTRLNFRQYAAEDAQERHFLTTGNGFVVTPAFTKVLGGDMRYVVARKGAGKTALLFAVESHFRARSVPVHYLTLQDFSTLHFFRQLDVLDHELNIERPIIIRNLWRFTIGVGLMDLVRSHHALGIRTTTDTELRSAWQTVLDYLSQHGFPPNDDRRVELGVCMDLAVSRELPRFLAQHDRAEATRRFPTDASFEVAERALCTVLRSLGGAAVLIDDLDRWIEASNYENMLPFVQGLLEACELCEKSKLAAGNAQIRVCIPRDLFTRLDYRHKDKLSAILHLHYCAESLKEMLARKVSLQLNMLRTNHSLGLKSEQITYVLNQLFGADDNRLPVVYDYWGRPRDVVKYILMHTFHRPRDLWMMMIQIVNLSISAQRGSISPDDVVQGVKAGSADLMNTVLAEYRLRMPNLQDLVYSFEDWPCTFSYVRLKTHVADRLCTILDRDAVDERVIHGAISDLYEVGFLGKLLAPQAGQAEPKPIRPGDTKTSAQFVWAREKLTLADTDTFVIHPVFIGPLNLGIAGDGGIHEIVEPSQ